MRSVGAQDKVLVELIANDRRDAAVAYIENWGNDARRFPTHATPEGIRVDLPLTEGLPDDVHLMSDGQLELISRLMRTVWEGDLLTVTGWGFIRNIDLAANPPEIGLELVSPDGATRIPLELERYDEPRLDVFGGHWHCDYRPGGWRARVTADQIPADADREWSFELSVAAAGVRRTSRLREVSMAGSSSVPQTHVDGDGVARTVLRGHERQVVVRVTRYPAYALTQEVDATGVATVVFRAAGPRPGRGQPHRRGAQGAAHRDPGGHRRARDVAGTARPGLVADADLEQHVVRRDHPPAARCACAIATASTPRSSRRPTPCRHPAWSTTRRCAVG